MKKLFAVVFSLALFLFGCAGGAAMKDCGSDEKCFEDAAKTCSPASLKKTDDTGTIQTMVKGYEGNNCVLYMKISDSPQVPALKDKDMTCKFPKEALQSFSTQDTMQDQDIFKYCSGSLIDLLKSFGIGAEDSTPPTPQ